MLSRKSEPLALRIIRLQMTVDAKTGEAVEFTSNVPGDASVLDIAHELATLREAAWHEIHASQKRDQEFEHLIAEQVEANIKSAREKGKHLDNKKLDEERMRLNQTIARADAVVEAGARMLMTNSTPGAVGNGSP